jgi:hypothetical protein
VTEPDEHEIAFEGWDCPCGYFHLSNFRGGLNTFAACPHCGTVVEVLSRTEPA